MAFVSLPGGAPPPTETANTFSGTLGLWWTAAAANPSFLLGSPMASQALAGYPQNAGLPGGAYSHLLSDPYAMALPAGGFGGSAT